MSTGVRGHRRHAGGQNDKRVKADADRTDKVHGHDGLLGKGGVETVAVVEFHQQENADQERRAQRFRRPAIVAGHVAQEFH